MMFPLLYTLAAYAGASPCHFVKISRLIKGKAGNEIQLEGMRGSGTEPWGTARVGKRALRLEELRSFFERGPAPI